MSSILWPVTCGFNAHRTSNVEIALMQRHGHFRDIYSISLCDMWWLMWECQRDKRNVNTMKIHYASMLLLRTPLSGFVDFSIPIPPLCYMIIALCVMPCVFRWQTWILKWFLCNSNNFVQASICERMVCRMYQFHHYNDVIMSAMASQITSLTIVYSTAYSGAGQREHQSSASLAFVRGIHRPRVNSPHKWPVTRKMSPFNDIIMITLQFRGKQVWRVGVKIGLLLSLAGQIEGARISPGASQSYFWYIRTVWIFCLNKCECKFHIHSKWWYHLD